MKEELTVNFITTKKSKLRLCIRLENILFYFMIYYLESNKNIYFIIQRCFKCDIFLHILIIYMLCFDIQYEKNIIICGLSDTTLRSNCLSPSKQNCTILI